MFPVHKRTGKHLCGGLTVGKVVSATMLSTRIICTELGGYYQVDIDALAKATQQSIVTRLLANIFLFAVLMVSLAIGALELISTNSINPIITTIVGTGIGIAAHAAGINQGVVLQPLSVPTPVTGGTSVDSTAHN